jgi:hypothetical protein
MLLNPIGFGSKSGSKVSCGVLGGAHIAVKEHNGAVPMETPQVILPAQNLCPICRNGSERLSDGVFVEWRCPRCGTFDYQEMGVGWRRVRSPEQMVRLSGWVREQNAFGVIPARITPESAARAMSMRLPGLQERSMRVLAVLVKRYPRANYTIEVSDVTGDLEIQGVSYSQDRDEVVTLIEILGDARYLKYPQKGIVSVVNMSVKGLLAAEALSASGANSAQGFVAMWFDKSMDDVWVNGFDPAIRAAGFRPQRIDTKEYVGGISDEIMAEIRRSRFVVADYTGHRQGVYFEAGFALGLGLTVIPTCRSYDIPKLHFDIRHLNTLSWNTPSDLADSLNKRIRALIGIGPDAVELS